MADRQTTEASTQFGKYQILDRIAYGGMAELFRARIQGDQGFQKLVAVKKMHAHFSIDPEVVAAFIEEAKLAAFLQHPNIVQIYDFGSLAGVYFIVMEYLQGKDLRAVTTALDQRQRLLGLENSLSIAASICSGLDYAHRLSDMAGRPLNIVHRDISPQNIFVTYAGQVKILDFGIAKATDRSAVTEAGALRGKVAYMSPEQARGRSIDHRSDQFAVGIILYELLTGRRMYQGNNMEILRRAQNGDFIPPEEALPDLPPDLRHVLERLLAPAPEERFPDCGSALAALEECLGDLSARAIERHLADLVSDLFAGEKRAEEAVLQELALDDAASREKGGAGGQVLAGSAGAPPPAIPGSSDKSSRQLLRRWLGLSLAVVLAAVSLFAWMKWYSPGDDPGRSLEAFEARGYWNSRPADDAEGAGASRPSGRFPAAPRSPLEQQALSVMGKDPVKARDLWAQVVDQAPDNIRAHFSLGLVHLELGSYAQAVTAFERVLALAPGMIDARFNLGFAYAKMERYEEAAALYEQVADQAPEYVDEVLFNLAIVKELQGDREGAVRSLQSAIRFNPHNVRAISYLARMEGRFSTPP